MKRIKTAAGIVAILEGFSGLVGGILVAVFGGGRTLDFIETLIGWGLKINGNYTNERILSLISMGLIIGGVIVAVLGFVYILLGISTCKKSSGKGTVVAFLVFSILLGNIINIILTIIYLMSKDNEDQNYNNNHQNYDDYQNFN